MTQYEYAAASQVPPVSTPNPKRATKIAYINGVPVWMYLLDKELATRGYEWSAQAPRPNNKLEGAPRWVYLLEDYMKVRGYEWK